MAPTVAPAPAAAPVMMMRRLAVVSLLALGRVVAVDDGHHRRDEEEDGVHDTEREARLEHAARLVDADVKRVEGRASQDAEIRLVRAVGRDRGAVHARDKAEIIDSRDEGADESQVDEADEARVGAGPVVAEQGEKGPGEAEDGDDEKNEDVVGRHLVVLEVVVDEPGEHAHARDLSRVSQWVQCGLGMGGCKSHFGTKGLKLLTYQCDNLHETPEGEHDCEKHLGGLCALMRAIRKF